MLRQLIAACLAVLPVAPALAGAAAPEPVAPAAPSPVASTPVAPRRAVDESALRYYAGLGQRDRVAMETLRLKRLDPAWRVPDDLYAHQQSHPDEAPLWVLFGQDRLGEIEAAIRVRQAVEPGWMPSDELAAKIKAKHLRVRVTAWAASGEWHAIVESFKGTGIAWAKDDAEVLWIVAEAYARENDCGEAYIVYRSILVDHGDFNERRATVERAIALVPMSYVEKLLALERRDEHGAGEFAAIAIDITRARLSAFLHDEVANPVGAEELDAFKAFVHEAKDPNEPGLVAWTAFKRRDYPQALDWFKFAIARGGDAMIAHGLAHTLRMMGLKREAEEVAYAWREPLVNNAILFIDLLEEDFTKERPPFIEPARVARYAQVTAATESGEGAQALGWYAYNTCQYPQALLWFGRAVAWLPKEATAYGYALSLQRMHRSKDFRDVVNRYDGLFPKVAALAFDDGVRKPPPPCETDPNAAAAPRGAAVHAGPDWTGRTMADTLKPRSAPPPGFTPASGRPRVPPPDAVANGNDGSVPPMSKTIEFPAPVSPENLLRFSALRVVASEDARPKLRQGLQQASWPLVARRVPGVGVMPYERWGFTLLPGWDGTREASSPTAAERSPPQGTLWALQRSLQADVGGDGHASEAAFAPSPAISPSPAFSATSRSDRRS